METIIVARNWRDPVAEGGFAQENQQLRADLQWRAPDGSCAIPIEPPERPGDCAPASRSRPGAGENSVFSIRSRRGGINQFRARAIIQARSTVNYDEHGGELG